MPKYQSKSKITCPHCGMEVTSANFKRWHEDKSCIERKERNDQEKLQNQKNNLPVNLYNFIMNSKISEAERNLKHANEFWGTKQGLEWFCKKNGYNISDFENWITEDENGKLIIKEMRLDEEHLITKKEITKKEITKKDWVEKLIEENPKFLDSFIKQDKKGSLLDLIK